MLLGGGVDTPDRQSLAAFEHVIDDIIKKQSPKPSVVLNSHPGVLTDQIGAVEELQKNPTGPHPLNYGEERFGRYLDIMIECQRAKVARKRSLSPSRVLGSATRGGSYATVDQHRDSWIRVKARGRN